ncbi:MAG: hypothetical protein M3394_07285, partial [Actinomycetota bacterium]|nr:hypothetical protein [Actinomycetota bacterium]
MVVVRDWRPTLLPPIPKAAQEAYQDQVHVFAEPVTRRLYAVDPTGWVAAYHLDTLEPLAPLTRVQPAAFSSLLPFPDPDTGGLYLAVSNGAALELLYLDVRDGAIQVVIRKDLSATLAGQAVAGFGHVPGSPLLWLVSTPLASAASRGVSATITELETSESTRSIEVSWSRPLPPECPGPAGWGTSNLVPAALGYVPDLDKPGSGALFLGCANPDAFVVTAPVLRGAAKLVVEGEPRAGRTAPGAFRLFPRDGTFARGLTVFDPASRRLVMTATSSATGGSAYVFDANVEAYIGNISLGPNELAQAGVNIVSGRYYGLSPGQAGLVVGDIRETPIGQGWNFPAFGTMVARPAAPGPMATDPVRSRVFVHYAGDAQERANFLIVEDRLPPSPPPPPPDLDANTTDVPEVPGRTEAKSGGGAQGYGFRVRQIGGSRAIEAGLGTNFGNVVPVGSGTRELRGAYLNHLGLLADEASASVIAADIDRENTRNDLGKHADRPAEVPEDFRLPGGVDPFAPPGDWPIKPATCIDLDGDADRDEETGSTVTCDRAQRVATAAADAGGLRMPVVHIGSSSITASATGNTERGSVASVTASAQDVVVLGRLRIREVRATATAIAHGRRGTASTSWVRVLRGVALDGTELCTDACNLSQVTEAVNAAFAGRVAVTFPVPDQMATKGGYAAIVRRSTAEQLEERFLNGQEDHRVEVPAVVVTVYEDGQAPSRTRVDLAAVEAEALYGITVIG